MAVTLWVVILGAVAVVVRFFVLPIFEDKKDAQLASQTGSEGRYQHEIRLGADSFSGYCLLRSPDLADRLSKEGIRLTVIDDEADYAKRLKALEKGDLNMAVFPINSFLQMGTEEGEFPASIVYLIDETQGADAIVADRNSIASIQDLNRKDARIVATPDSPSEFLARVMLASFNLSKIPESDWLIDADGSNAAYQRFIVDGATKPYAYAMWEPDVSKARRDPDTIVLLDSSKVRGYIVDVLVVRREFLIENYPTAKAFVESYARTAYANQSNMVGAVMADAEAQGEKMGRQDAESTVNGIAWQNTLENYAHFGLLPDNHSVENIEDILIKITRVMVKTGLLDQDPIAGKASTLYFDKILQDMQQENFHPGRDINVVEGVDLGDSNESLRETGELRKLNDRQWTNLISVGELRVEPISFGRGTARITIQGKRELEALAETLKSWPQYYLIVTGRVRPGGDEAASLNLAKERANATLSVLLDNGIARDRMKATAEIGAADAPEAQSVSFMVGQLPY